MDSKNIYIGCDAMMRKAEREKLKDNNEWQFVGEGKESVLEEVQRRVNEFLSVERVFFVLDRHKSKEIEKEVLAQGIKNNLQKNTIKICEKDFEKFMMFHYIGVVWQGVFRS